MKKFFKIIGISLFVIFVLMVIVLFSGFIFLKNLDIKKYKPQIVKAASRALDRAVDFKDIDLLVSINQGIRLHVKGLSIAENAEFGTDQFVNVQEIDARVDILASVTRRQISIPNIIIRSPQMRIIRSLEGQFNVQRIGPKADASGSAAVSMGALPALLINSLKIENARIMYLDQSVVPPAEFSVTQLTIGVEKFTLDQPFAVSGDAAILTAEKNFSLSTTVQPVLSDSGITITDMNIVMNLGQLPLEELKALPVLSAVALPRILEGQLKVKIHQAQISNQGVDHLNTDIFLNNAKVIVENIVPGISLEARRLDLSLEKFTLDSTLAAQLMVKAAVYQNDINVDLKTKVFFDLKKAQARIVGGELVTDLALWPIAKLKEDIAPLKDVPLSENLSGKLRTTIKEAVVSAAGLQTFLLDAKLNDGSILLNDMIPGVSLALAKTDMEIGNFSLDKQFSLSFKTAYLNTTQNISFGGAVTFDLKTQTVSIQNGLTELNLNGFDLKQFQRSGLVPAGVVLPQELAGVWQIQMDELAASPQGLGDMKVDLKWKNGKIGFDDIVPGVSLAFDQVNFKVKDFSLTKPFAVDASLGYESDETNLSFVGQMILDQATQSVALSDTVIKMDLAKLPLARIKTKIAAFKEVSIPEYLKGDLNVSIAKASVGVDGLSLLDSDVVLKDWDVKLKELVIPFRGEVANFKVTEKQLSAKQLAVNFGKGQIVTDLQVDDYLQRQNFSLLSEVKDVDLAQILDQSQSPVKVAGLVDASFKAKGQGADIQSIVGDGKFEVKDAKLKDFNVLKAILDKISLIPNFSSSIVANLSEKYQIRLNSSDTMINKVSGVFTLAGGNISIDPVSVESDEFVFSGKAQTNFEQSYTIDGAFKITTELSVIMRQALEEVAYLYDANNNISLPVHMSGQGSQKPVIAVKQSALDLGQNAARNEGKKQLGKILDKALGVSHEMPAQQQIQDAPPESQQSPGEQIIGGILDKVFK